MGQGQGRNSSPQVVRMVNCSTDAIEPPANVKFSAKERAFWFQFAKARMREDWSESDLVSLVKIVKLESKLRECDKVIEEQGPTILNDKGIPIVSPIVRIQDIYLRQQVTLMRSLQLTAGKAHPNVVKSRAIQAGTYAAIKEESTDYKARPDS